MMPYIPRNEQDVINRRINTLGVVTTPGQLNYAINILLFQYLAGEPTTYQRLNEIIGALECAKLEFTRRLVVPYEDLKRDQNGDIYPST